MNVYEKSFFIFVVLIAISGFSFVFYLNNLKSSKIEDIENMLSEKGATVHLCGKEIDKNQVLKLFSTRVHSKVAGSHPKDKFMLYINKNSNKRILTLGSDSKRIGFVWVYDGEVDLIGTPLTYFQDAHILLKAQEGCSS